MRTSSFGSHCSFGLIGCACSDMGWDGLWSVLGRLSAVDGPERAHKVQHRNGVVFPVAKTEEDAVS